MKELMDTSAFAVISYKHRTSNKKRRCDMALLDDIFKGNITAGLAIGIGAAVLAPVMLPVLASVAKPLAKAAIKSGFILYEKGKEAVAEMSEMVEDVVAEARSELSEMHQEVAETAPEQGAQG